jgi:hypothetical protein
MSNYASLDPITGLPNGQAVLPESFAGPSPLSGGASAQPAPTATAANGPGYGTGIASLAPVIENLFLGAASGPLETAPGIAAVPTEKQILISNHACFNWPPPPPGGGGWW